MASTFMSAARADRIWTFDFIDEAIWQIRLDHAVTFVTEHLEVRIERDFQLVSDGRRSTVILDSPDEVALVIPLHQAPVHRLTVSDDGALRMECGDGESIEVAPSDSAYEAFDLVIQGGWKFVSTPGGGISVWPGRE